MGQFGGFYKGDRKKAKKTLLEKKAQMMTQKQSFVLPKVEIIKKGSKYEE